MKLIETSDETAQLTSWSAPQAPATHLQSRRLHSTRLQLLASASTRQALYAQQTATILDYSLNTTNRHFRIDGSHLRLQLLTHLPPALGPRAISYHDRPRELPQHRRNRAVPQVAYPIANGEDLYK